MSDSNTDIFWDFIGGCDEFSNFINQCQKLKSVAKELTNKFQVNLKDGFKCPACFQELEWNTKRKSIIKLKSTFGKSSQASSAKYRPVLDRANKGVLEYDTYQKEQNKDEEIKDLKEWIEQLNEEKKELEKTIENLADELDTKTKINQTLEKQVDDCDRLQDQIKCLNQQVESLTKKCNKIESEKLENDTNLQKEKISLEHQLSNKEQDIKDFKQKLSQLEKEKSKNLKEKEEVYQKEISYKDVSLRNIKQEKENLEKSKENLNKIVLDLRHRNQELEKEIKDINACSKFEIEIDINLSKWLKENCKGTFFQYLNQEEKDYFSKKKNGLNEVVCQLSIYEKRIQNQDEEIRKLSCELEKLKKEKNNQLEDKNLKIKEQEQKLCDKGLELEHERSKLMHELEKLKDERNTLDNQLENKKTKVKQQAQVIQDYEQQVTKLNDQWKELDEEKRKLIHDYGKQKVEMKNQLDDKNLKIKELEQKLCEFIKQITAAKNKEKEFDEERRKLISGIEKLQEEKDALNNQLENQTFKIKQKEKELTDQKKNLVANIEELTKNSCNLVEELVKRNKEIELKDGEISSMQLKLSKLKQKCTQLQDENGNLLSKNKEVCEQLKEMGLCKKEIRAMVLRGALKESGISDSIISCINRMLVKKIRTRLTKNGVELDVKTCQEQPSSLLDPMIVIGLKRGRVEHDIENSLKGVEVSKVTCCVYIHMISSKDKTNEIVPTKLSRSDFPPVSDMVYDTTDGIFDCDINQQALETIAKLLAANWA